MLVFKQHKNHILVGFDLTGNGRSVDPDMTDGTEMLSDLFPTVNRPQAVVRTRIQFAKRSNRGRQAATGERDCAKRRWRRLWASAAPRFAKPLSGLKQQRLLSSDASGAYFVAEWDRQTLWEIATLRAALESLAFSLALQNLSQEDFGYLEQIIQQMEEMDADPASSDYKRMAQFDFQFHTFIWSRTGHALLEQALEEY